MHVGLRSWLVGVAVVLGALLRLPAGATPVTPAEPPPPLRIMPLGDSITAGVGADGAARTDGGYRGVLGALLAGRGYRAVFVGSRDDDSGAIPNPDHEGWPGYVVRSFPSDPGPGQLYGPLVRAALDRERPDVVLLMAGTNDLLRLEKHAPGYTLPNIVGSMNLLIGQIVGERPAADVIVAPVVASPRVDACALRGFAGVDPCPDQAVAGLRTVVAAWAARGNRVFFAPAMADAVPSDAEHFPDGIHPCGGNGYASIAGVWLEAIERTVGPPPDLADSGER